MKMGKKKNWIKSYNIKTKIWTDSSESDVFTLWAWFVFRPGVPVWEKM